MKNTNYKTVTFLNMLNTYNTFDSHYWIFSVLHKSIIIFRLNEMK